MDAIRAAMALPQIYYLGISYGTRLGSVYAHLFPDRLAAAVLDGSMKPVNLSNLEYSALDAWAMEKFLTQGLVQVEWNSARQSADRMFSQLLTLATDGAILNAWTTRT